MEYEDDDGAKEAVELTRWPDSGTITAIAPGAPTGLTATANGTTQIDLSWTAPASDGGADITGYKIEISSDGGNAWTTHLADTSDANTTYAHTGLAGGTTRHYRVSAINTIGTSTASNIDDATTNAAPTVANAIPDQEATVDTAFDYAFPDTTFSDADSDALTYTATALPTWLMFAATTRAFSGTPRAANVGTVSVMVTASDGKGGSVSDTFDILVSAATNNAATGAPTITGTPTVGETLTAVTTAIMDDDGLTTPGYTYQWIRVATDNTETDISPATANTYTLVTDDQGKTIKVKVSFTDDANNPETLTSAATTAVAAAPNTAATGAPTISGTPQVGETLTAGTSAIMDDDGLNNVSYTYQWIRVDGGVETNISMATASTYTLMTDDQGKTIRVKVSFTDDASNPETLTSVATATVSAAAATAPGAPTGLSATASGATRIDLAWTAPASSGGSPISGYRIESSPDGTSSWSDLEANTNNTNTTYAHTGLAGGTTRHYRVSAINDTGPGPASNVDSATTSQTGQTTVTFEASLYTAVEGGAAATVTVQLTPAPSAPVTIPLEVTRMGTTTAADYSGIPTGVTFTTGQTTVTFTVTATVDAQRRRRERVDRVRVAAGRGRAGCPRYGGGDAVGRQRAGVYRELQHEFQHHRRGARGPCGQTAQRVPAPWVPAAER